MPLQSAHAGAVAAALTSIFLQHSYIPITLLSDLGTSLVAKFLREPSALLELKLHHASLKPPQRIGVVERSHPALKRFLEPQTDEKWTTW